MSDKDRGGTNRTCRPVRQLTRQLRGLPLQSLGQASSIYQRNQDAASVGGSSTTSEGTRGFDTSWAQAIPLFSVMMNA